MLLWAFIDSDGEKVDEFDDRFYLLVPIKTLPGEMWLQTLYVEEKKRFMKRWEKREPLYRRK